MTRSAGTGRQRGPTSAHRSHKQKRASLLAQRAQDREAAACLAGAAEIARAPKVVQCRCHPHRKSRSGTVLVRLRLSIDRQLCAGFVPGRAAAAATTAATAAVAMAAGEADEAQPLTARATRAAELARRGRALRTELSRMAANGSAGGASTTAAKSGSGGGGCRGGNGSRRGRSGGGGGKGRPQRGWAECLDACAQLLYEVAAEEAEAAAEAEVLGYRGSTPPLAPRVFRAKPARSRRGVSASRRGIMRSRGRPTARASC